MTIDEKEALVIIKLKEWAKIHDFGNLAVSFTVHQGKIVGVREIKDRTERIYSP